jgi:hypothetical protein
MIREDDGAPECGGLQKLIEQPVYSDADKKRILELLAKHKALGESGPFFLRETRQRWSRTGRLSGWAW